MKPLVVRGRKADLLAREHYTDERCHIFESWNDESDPRVSITRARVEPGITTALHALAVDERYVVLSGVGHVEVEGLPPTEVAPGDVVVIPKGHSQRIENRSDEDLVFLCICTPRFEADHYQDMEDEP